MRPVLIIQNDRGQPLQPHVIAAAITSRTDKPDLPTHIPIDPSRCGLTRNSIVLLEQIRTIDKRRLRERTGCLDAASMNRVDRALQVSMGLGPQNYT